MPGEQTIELRSLEGEVLTQAVRAAADALNRAPVALVPEAAAEHVVAAYFAALRKLRTGDERPSPTA